MPSLAQLSEAARETVTLAARVARSVQQDLAAVRTVIKDDRSPVTVADYACQAIVSASLRDRLGAAFAASELVGEEDASFLRRASSAAYRAATLSAIRRVRPEIDEPRMLDLIDAAAAAPTQPQFWTIDPIDGTKGFLRGQQYAVALALIEAGTPTIGALACPNLPRALEAPLDHADPVGTIYVAARGEGVEEHPCAGSLRESPRKLARVSPLGNQRIRCCASVESGHSSVSDTDRLLGYLDASREVLRLDSSAKYAVVARGQADAYLRLPTRQDYIERIWDHAAGMVVASEAGCVVSDIRGRDLDFGQGRGLARNAGVIVARPDAHQRIIRGIVELGIGSG
jgi:3'(2'), 5'-bisphosphate nucleotidase